MVFFFLRALGSDQFLSSLDFNLYCNQTSVIHLMTFTFLAQKEKLIYIYIYIYIYIALLFLPKLFCLATKVLFKLLLKCELMSHQTFTYSICICKVSVKYREKVRSVLVISYYGPVVSFLKQTPFKILVLRIVKYIRRKKTL